MFLKFMPRLQYTFSHLNPKGTVNYDEFYGVSLLVVSLYSYVAGF